MTTEPVSPITRPNTESPLCPIFHDAVELIGRRWNGAILYVLMRRPHRYNELLSAIPNISDRVLTVRLRELETYGLITRNVNASPGRKSPTNFPRRDLRSIASSTPSATGATRRWRRQTPLARNSAKT